MLVFIDIKIEYNNFVQTQTVCYFYYSFFKQITLFFVHLLIYDNQPLIVKLQKQYKKQRRCENLNNSIYSDKSVGYIELTF